MFSDFDSIRDLTQAVRRRRVTPSEIVQHSLSLIAGAQPRLNAFIRVIDASALAAARALEQRLHRKRDPGLLTAVPLAVKDLLLTRDAPTTAGSRVYGEGLESGEDAAVVASMRRAGAIVVGKTNLHEVALGVTTVNEHFGPSRNPWNPQHVSGGSSGGSAVAVAAQLCPAAIGTDTRGSIRIPASCCGITGFKPTYGLVSVQGVVPLAPSLDHVGPMARSVDDAALLLAAMVSSTRLRDVLVRAHRAGTRGLVIGISEYHLRDMDSAVATVIESALRDLRPLVKNVTSVTIAQIESVQEASSVLASAEAVAFHDESLRTHPERFGPMVRTRLEGGYRRTAVEYVRALEKAAQVRAAFADTFRSVDLLVGATLPAIPGRIDESHARINGVETNIVDAFTRFNSPQNVAGLPALSVPCGFAGGLPVGLQIFGPAAGDATVLSLGAAYQRATDWHRRVPAGPRA
ncbi:MAG: amidase [Gemmatimonadaceae bacterium]